MEPDTGVNFYEQPDKRKEWAEKVDESYVETYEALKELHEDDFSEVAFMNMLIKFKTEQVACLIGNNLTDYDKRILAGVIERHIAGVIYKG